MDYNYEIAGLAGLAPLLTFEKQERFRGWATAFLTPAEFEYYQNLVRKIEAERGEQMRQKIRDEKREACQGLDFDQISEHLQEINTQFQEQLKAFKRRIILLRTREEKHEFHLRSRMEIESEKYRAQYDGEFYRGLLEKRPHVLQNTSNAVYDDRSSAKTNLSDDYEPTMKDHHWQNSAFPDDQRSASGQFPEKEQPTDEQHSNGDDPTATQALVSDEYVDTQLSEIMEQKIAKLVTATVLRVPRDEELIHTWAVRCLSPDELQEYERVAAFHLKPRKHKARKPDTETSNPGLKRVRILLAFCKWIRGDELAEQQRFHDWARGFLNAAECASLDRQLPGLRKKWGVRVEKKKLLERKGELLVQKEQQEEQELKLKQREQRLKGKLKRLRGEERELKANKKRLTEQEVLIREEGERLGISDAVDAVGAEAGSYDRVVSTPIRLKRETEE